ncbi:MAG: oxidoreductase [Herbinix sp.]|nr:oxidoreductase [Herbinix sp.]
MLYKDYQNRKILLLGFGAMRLPIKDGVYANINEAETQKMVDYAMGHRVNYYDTAWGYHDGQSEIVLGKVLSKYPRESY